MITCQLEQLPKEAESELRKWFNQPAFGTLLRVVESQVKDHEVRALGQALEADPNNSKLELSNGLLREAQAWNVVAQRLRQLAQQDFVYQIAKLS